jgi:hypothetical protein
VVPIEQIAPGTVTQFDRALGVGAGMMVRLFLHESHESAASFEVPVDAQCRPLPLFVWPTMKLHPRFGSLVLARLGQALRSLQESLRVGPPQPALSLATIPIRADRPVRPPARRIPYRGE